jgi:Matrixin
MGIAGSWAVRMAWLLGVIAVALSTAVVGATPASASSGSRPVNDRIEITTHEFDGKVFTMGGTAVPHTTLRVLVRLAKSADWRRVARARVDRAGAWTARFADPTRRQRTAGGGFLVKVEQIGSTTATSGRVGFFTQAGDPDPAPDPVPEPAPAPALPVVPVWDVDAPAAGDATSYSLLHVDANGRPTRWNPCRPIPYFVNATGMPEGAAATIAEAFTRLASDSAVAFYDGGGTDLVPWQAGDATARLDRGEGIYIAFATEATVPALAGTVIGQGGGASRSDTGTGARFVAGMVVVDLDAQLSPGFTSGASLGGVLMHELGHVMGLGHVDDPTQLMYPRARTGGPATPQAGDLAGLQALLAGGCF